MAKNSQPWDLNPILEAFLKSMEGKATDENFDELSLRIKDLNGLFKDLIQFFKTQGLYNKELGDVIKRAVEFEKTQTKSRKGQGISQDTAHLYISQELSKYFALSARGKSGAFDINSKNDLIKAMKDNLSAYDKLVTSVNDLQKTITDAVNALGGKLGQSMGGSNKKDSSGGGFLGLFGAATGRGSGTKDPDLKSAAPKGNPFMKGIGTLIGFLGNMGGNGFLGRLKKAISEFFVQAGLDVLKLAAYGLLSLVRNGELSNVLKVISKIVFPLFSVIKGVSKIASGGFSGFLKGLLKGGDKAAIKTSTKAGLKVGAKTAAKTIAKGSLIGGAVGSLINVGSGIGKWKEGDKSGALMEFGSGSLPWIGALIGLVFGGPAGAALGFAVGSVASIIADIGIGIRDYNRAKNEEADATKKGLQDINDKQEEANKQQGGFFNWLKSICPWGKEDNDNDNDSGSGNPGSSVSVSGAPGEKVSYMARPFKERKKAAEEYYNKKLANIIGVGNLKHQQKEEEKLAAEVSSKFGVSMGNIAPWLTATDNWEGLSGVTLQKVLKEASPNAVVASQNSNASPGVGASASLNNIGAGQSYTASSAGGSKLGDAFFGKHDTISAFGGFRRPERRGHNGIDLPYPEGTTVRAFLPGTVEYAGWSEGFGNTIGIRHGNMVSIYGHLSKIGVNVGQKIKRGQEIGKSGSTGSSVSGSKPGSKVAPHLHYEVRPSMNLEISKKKGGAVDPVAYVASALGYSVDSLPDSGPMFADSEPSMDSSRSASAPKGVYNEEGNVVASAGEGGTSIAEELKNAYANNGFDQTGNTQFLAAINSIRVQLGKYQQIGMVTGG